jgi:2-dehydropantoate 2-reductase
MAAAGHDVAFIARGAHRDAIRRDGRRAGAPAGRIQHPTLQNGVDSVERLARILGDDATIGGATYIVATIARPGVVRQTGAMTKVHCGRLDRRPDAVLARYVEQIKAATSTSR